MADLPAYLTLLVAILFGVVGQLLLKQGMLQRPNFQLKELLSAVIDWRVLGGFVSYGLSVLLYLNALATLDLSLAYPTVSLGYVLVILLSKLFFQEEVPRGRWAAVLIICAGVALVGLGAG